MRAPIEQNQNVDQKIHHFLSTKSPLRQISKKIAEHFVHARRDARRADSDISYEPLDWNHNESLTHSYWQKAH